MGEGGVPTYFCELGAHAKFRNPTLTPYERKVTQGERKKEREKMPLIVDTTFRDTARTRSDQKPPLIVDTLFGPIRYITKSEMPHLTIPWSFLLVGNIIET